MKTKKELILICLLLFTQAHGLVAQCNVVSGSSGTILVNSQPVTYTVLLSTGASMINLGPDGSCGHLFPGIMAPWSGNMDITTKVTYVFSAPVSTIHVFLAYVGLYTIIAPESFTFTTNGAIPSLIVNSGTCAAWNVSGNQTASPNIMDALNAIVSVGSSTPFTSLSIFSGSNSSSNGGSSYGLCDQGLLSGQSGLMPEESRLFFYPNPSSGQLVIDHKGTAHDKLEIYNMVGEKIVDRDFIQPGSFNLDLSQYPSGTYMAKIVTGDKMRLEKIIVNK